jgi:hypothetical protein
MLGMNFISASYVLMQVRTVAEYGRASLVSPEATDVVLNVCVWFTLMPPVVMVCEWSRFTALVVVLTFAIGPAQENPPPPVLVLAVGATYGTVCEWFAFALIALVVPECV